MEKESKTLEYKLDINESFLKTVSAFANYNGGDIIFGVDDDLNIIGLDDIINKKLDIENQINGSIKPQINYRIQITNKNTIVLHIFKGDETPYLYNNKAYRRNDIATIEVDTIELKKLILDGMNKRYEDIASRDQDLHFTQLNKYLTSKLNIESINNDILSCLNLYNNKDGYNNAAYLLSDEYHGPSIDIGVFGESLNIFKKRATLNDMSIIEQYHKALEIFKDYYVYEEVSVPTRVTVETIPFKAFKEALANAIIHKDYMIDAHSKIEMHPDEIIIYTPGGLPDGINENEFKEGNVFCLRNPIIANVFHWLDIAETFATGIKRIKKCYKDYEVQPSFKVSENIIVITLPKIKPITLTKNEHILQNEMELFNAYLRSDIERKTKLSKYALIRVLNKLIERGYVEKTGSGTNVIYTRIK